MDRSRKLIVNDNEPIEMPPLDYSYPSEMGGSQVSMPVQQEDTSETAQYSEKMLSLYDLPAAEQQEEGEEVEEFEGVEEVEEVGVVAKVAESAPQPKKQSKDFHENVREMRLAKEKAEQRANDLMDKMIAMQTMKEQVEQNTKLRNQQLLIPEPKEWYDELSPEDLTENKYLQRMAQEVKSVKAQLKAQEAVALLKEQEARDVAAIARAKSQYPDMDQVVNGETIKALISQYPTEAADIEQISNKYNQAVLAYTTIKNLGIYKQVENTMATKKPSYESDILRAKVNASKPRPLSSISPQQGDSPLTHANGFANGYASEEMQAKYRAEMKEAASRY